MFQEGSFCKGLSQQHRKGRGNKHHGRFLPLQRQGWFRIPRRSYRPGGGNAHYFNAFWLGACSSVVEDTSTPPLKDMPSIEIKLENRKVRLGVESETQINIIPLRLLPYQALKAMNPSKVKINPNGSRPIQVRGEVRLDMVWQGEKRSSWWYVVDDSDLHSPLQPFLSNQTASLWGLISFHNKVHVPRSLEFVGAISLEYAKIKEDPRWSEVFSGLGCLRGYEVKLYPKEGTKPFNSPQGHHQFT